MKIAILGATGLTGQQLVKQALDDGHEVIAIVRNRSKVNIVHDKLTVVEANIFSDDDLMQHFQNVDAVMSTLGFSPMNRTITGYSDATRCAVNAMREVGCKRLIVMHAWYSDKSARNEGSFIIRWILIPMIAPVLDNMRETELYLEAECDDIDYTVVSPPGLLNAEKTDAEFEVLDNQFYIPGAATQIPRADVARYMLKILQDESSYKKVQAISIKK